MSEFENLKNKASLNSIVCVFLCVAVVANIFLIRELSKRVEKSKSQIDALADALGYRYMEEEKNTINAHYEKMKSLYVGETIYFNRMCTEE